MITTKTLITMAKSEIDHFWDFTFNYIFKLVIIKTFEFFIHLFWNGFYTMFGDIYEPKQIIGLEYPWLIILFHTIYYQILK